MTIFTAKFYTFDISKNISRLRRAFYKASHKDNIKYALKVGIAVVLSHLCATALGLGVNPWAAISAIIVMQVHVAASLEMCVLRAMGTLIGALIGYCTVKLLPGGAAWQSVGYMITTTLCAIVMRWDARFRLAGITAVVVIGGSTLTSEIGLFAIDRCMEIIIGILSALVVSIYVWPVSGAGILFANIKKQYAQAGDLLQKISNAFLENKVHLLPSILDNFHIAVDNNRGEYAKLREYEGINMYQQYPQIDILVASLEQIRTYLTSLLDSLDSDVENPVELHIAPQLAELSRVTVQGMNWVVNEDGYTETSAPDIRTALEDCTSRFANLRVDGHFRTYPHGLVIQLFAFYNALTHLAETVALLQERIEIHHTIPQS